MAMGVIFMRRADFGISPITAVPAAVTDAAAYRGFTLPGIGITLGNTTIVLHALCVIGQILLVRRVTLKSLLTMLVGIPFGKIIDLFNLLVGLHVETVVMRLLVLLIGLCLSGLGVLVVVGSDLMLPAPDELSHTISQLYDKKLSNVKIISDAIYVLFAIAIDLIFTGRLSTVGIGTVLSVLLVGRFVGWFGKLLPWVRMEPFWTLPKKEN